MRRLYWKIFFAFWLVMILVIATNLGVTWLQVRSFDSSEQQSEHISELAEKAVRKYEEDGLVGLNRWKDKLFQHKELRVLLLDDQNRHVSGRPLPAGLRFFLEGRGRDRGGDREWRKWRERPYPDDRRPPEHDGRRRIFKKYFRPVIWPVNGETGTRYHFVILNPHELTDHLYASSALFWRISISVLIVALVAMLLSHYLVRPIRVLQRASQKLADGDLNNRVASAMGNRRDELGQLGRDFDGMAQRIQALLEGQQQMLRDVSHELRTPLARLRIALELARKRSGESGELDRMELEAERINELIDEILQLVRLNNHSSDFQPASLELCGLLKPLIEDANFGQQRVQLQAPASLPVEGDDKLLCRAIENIIRNALKYSDEEVLVRLEAKADQALIRVLDSGPGVDESLLKRLFEPFFRADQARERETGGYGLGLAIAARAVRLHGGEISAENRPEGGLAVTISLPRSPLS